MGKTTGPNVSIEYTRETGLQFPPTAGAGRGLAPSYTVTGHTVANVENVVLTFYVPGVEPGTSVDLTSAPAFLDTSATIQVGSADIAQLAANAIAQPKISGCVISGISFAFSSQNLAIPASGKLQQARTYKVMRIVGQISIFTPTGVFVPVALTVPVTVHLFGLTQTS